ncbi:GFA family protein [Pararhizobium haloflavum]|uniref:GFA family protein n=1 Tax=Pararhizobium haloflavum TaxID=2037914 RepID=UPI000C1A4204|nr:GFA family protein [Pararhizobium haloflavum]
MTLDNTPEFSGGCQCGAVRFHVRGRLGKPSICHCRMCQKAYGNFFAPLVSVHEGTLAWTRGAPKRFQSSNHVKRGFCEACGTPLTYEAPDGVALSIGAFDDPSTIAPEIVFGIEGKLPYADGLAALPARTTAEDEASNPFLASIVTFQHPDHDTPEWPMPGDRS